VAFLSTPPGLFADGFETGDLSKWTSTSGMTAQQQEVHGGAWAVRMTSAGGSAATKVYRTLATPQTDVYVRTWFKVVSLSTTTTMIKLRDAAGTHILSVFTDPNGTIGLKNELSGASTASTAVAALGAWHQVLLHFIVNGTASQTEVWLDGSRIAALSKTDSLGTNAVGRVELGNTTTPRTYDIVFDDAAVDARLNDTAAPTVPAGLTATAVSGFEVDLAWQPSTDNVGIAGYDVFRNGTQIASLGPVTSYVDSSVAALTTYTYQVRARDSWANVSALSAGVTATTLRGNVFADDFESGTLASWAPVNGLAVQQQLVYAGAWAARATSSGTVTLPATGASAQAVLPADQPDLYYRVKFQLVGAGANPVNLLRFRTRAGTAVVTVSLSTAGALGYRNDVAALTTTSTTTVAPGRWYELEAHVLVNGAASQVDVWLDGAKVAALSKTEALGSAGIGRIELGDTSTTRTFDVAFDDARADTTFIPESTPPSTPANLLATVVSETRVDLTWNASTDASGVTGYTIYRNGTKIGAVDGATRSYSDTAAPAGKTSTYTVTATDAVGNVSKPSDPATATTPDTTPPTQPTGLTAQAPTQNRVDLSWTASTDNVGVVGYEIFRDGLSLAISTTNTYSDTTVAANTTYSYSVAARDAAGNLSPASAPPTVVTTAPLPPTTLTFTPTDDTYVQQDAPTTNFGTATQIIADNSPVKRLLLKFTVSGIGTRKVVSVKLRLRCVDASPFGGNFHRVADTSWTEGGVNWNAQPTADAATLATLGAVSANTTYEVDLTALVTRDGTYAIQADSTNADGAHYSSKEGAVTPQLVVSVSG
jgi:chitodextrinase